MTFIDAITILHLKTEEPQWSNPGAVHDTCEALQAKRLTSRQRKATKALAWNLVTKNGLISEEQADLNQLIQHLSQKRGKNATSV